MAENNERSLHGTRQICRLCTSMKNANHFIKIQDANHEVCLKLAKCCQIQILLSDALPKFVCHECVQLLNQSYAFYNKVHKAQDTLAAFFPSDDVLGKKPTNATDDDVVGREKNVSSNIVSPNKIKTEISDNHGKSEPEQHELIELHKLGVINDEVNENKATVLDGLNTTSPEREDKMAKNLDPILKANFSPVNKDGSEHVTEYATNRNRFICELCGNAYDQKYHFLLHIRRHTGDKQIPCKFCSSKFYNNSELNRHLRTHTGEKPYECKYCHRKFTDSSTQIKHERTHTKERPYKCVICEKSFTQTNTLKTHKLIHTGERLFSCTQCKRSFQQKKHLIKHCKSLTHIKNTSKNSNS